MNRVRSFFLQEAGECVADLRRELEQDPLDVSALHRAVRRFRGSADLARFGALAREARETERWLRDQALGTTAPESTEAMRGRMEAALESLERDLTEIREGRREEDPRMEEGMTEVEGAEGQGVQEVVPVDALEYQGAAALERALALREALEDAIVSNDPAGPVLDELFDLIRLGTR